jgi:hypothetical protein
MISCAYCAQPATMRILSTPDHVCFQHALEFWTGLLGYSHAQPAPCVKHERLCSCPACEELSMSEPKAVAAAPVTATPVVVEVPLDRDPLAFPLAS